MSSTWSHGDDTQPGSPNRDFDDAEKGLYDSTSSLPILPPLARLDGRPQNHIERADAVTVMAGRKSSQAYTYCPQETGQRVSMDPLPAMVQHISEILHIRHTA